MERDGESGQITILALGLGVVVLALVLLVVSVSAIHLERRELLAAADAAALDAASLLDVETYYANGGGDLVVTDQTVRAEVADFIATYSGALGVAGARIGEPTGTPDGRTVQVTLTMTAEIPIVPWLLAPFGGGVPLTVTSSARAG